jgi:CHAT domain-containing protein
MGPVVATLPVTTARLFISPDGPLNRLVFDAVSLDGRRLIERYETAMLPAASILPALRNRRRADHLQGVLAFGVPDAPAGADPAWRALPSLREAIPEARLAARSAPHSRLLAGRAGSEAALRREAPGDYGVLHLAAHAVVDEQVSARTALLLAPGDGEDGVVGMADVEAMGVGAELVVLSACRTAGGAILSGEGVLGLTSAFLGAGARAVIATAWPASDSAAAGQMRQFYAALGRGAPAGEALHRMKLARLAAGSPPSAWALFTLTGDPAMALAAPAPRPVRWWLLGLLVPPAGYLLSRRRRKADSTVRPSRSEA